MFILLLLQVFTGNTENDKVVFNLLPYIIARYVRLHPVSYKLKKCIRMELYGIRGNPRTYNFLIKGSVTRSICLTNS